MKKSVFLLALLLVLGVSIAQAQDSQEATEQTKEKAGVDKILDLLKLPEEARLAREAGIPDEEIREVMKEARKRKLGPRETGTILKEGSRASKENGNIEHFGAFVKERLNQGMRGKDLANAIHEEHRQRGKGKGNMNKNQSRGDKGKGDGDSKGKGDGKGQGQGQDGKKGGKSNGKNK